MSSYYKKKPHTEEEYLKLASFLVGRAEVEDAVNILEEARRELPDAPRILKALGKLYLKTDKPEKAAQCFQQVLKRHSNTIKNSNDIPDSRDFEYLKEKEGDLGEVDYSYFSQDQDAPNYNRKTLSLSSERQSNEKTKIIFKKKQSGTINQEKDYSSPKKNKNNLIGAASTPQSIDQGESDKSVVEKNTTERVEPIERVEPPDTSVKEFVVNDIEILTDFNDDQDLPLYDDDYDVDELDSGSDDSIDENSVSDWEVDIYGQWDNELFDEEQEDEVEEYALESVLDREDRARQAAIEFAASVDWNQESLPFLTDVFMSLGWGNARKALEREVLSGATPGELRLAFQVKALWKECDRYWINFNGAWAFGESATATYKHCSWRQAMQLLGAFDGLPSFEEVYDFLDVEFDYWYDNKNLRHLFPAFIKYLFKYRLNQTLPILPIEETLRFDRAVAFDEMNAEWSYHALSNEASKLTTLGIDFISRFAPKSYYVSDKPFDPKALDPVKRNPLEDNL